MMGGPESEMRGSHAARAGPRATARQVPLTRIASRIAKGNSGQSDLSPRGEELARRWCSPLLPSREKVAAKRPDEGAAS
ncbi:hypothetical protein X726_19630 [Mesorhizobium sp. L103C105A0]|nr:hypothetical protein X726_19630 [Mesorhizobium sp. L103C105A0]